LTSPPNFDRIARPYRWLEYLTLGRSLERAREVFLPLLKDRRQALILGDGDGRFTARLLAQNPFIQAEAVDISAAMLHLLRSRCEAHAGRLQTHQASAIAHRPGVRPDLLVTHFFLDCLTQSELDTLALRLGEALEPGGLWLLSDFRIPRGLMRAPAWILIRSLYLAFRILTGLRVTSLPDLETTLRRAGLTPIAQQSSLGGILTSQLWQRR
jgi:hypothetical protein